MSNTNIPETFPKCDLLTILKEKIETRHDIEFNFWGHLVNFKQRVCAEIQYINTLFPEYTPHDEHYHVNNLFHIADKILGINNFRNMNSAELFILAISLYGHDWGMAVSETEKQYIITSALPSGINPTESWILPDEKQRFIKFSKEHHFFINTEGHVHDIPIELWREYIRETHALRSGIRVKKYFDTIDDGIAESGLRICEGHWKNIEELEDAKYFPTNYSVLKESVNLRAIAVYLRLIDLFDLGGDRTPYVIWKFVAPQDLSSKMEWAKHRALQPITCPPYLKGRNILVDGSTDNHEVYAALEDLKHYCKEQLRLSNDILDRMNDERHELDIYDIQWRVAPRGFIPISIQFDFDRKRMFEILGEEIYQNDPYVFLRELLQNSIDAIRMRREILQGKNMEMGKLGVISVNIEHNNDGDTVITWRDDGIGMDEYVIRNYLAVAGKSYYRSEDYEHLGLKMDPISRFGIGILSCFTVTNRIEIETYKERYLLPQGKPLKIIIPDMTKQFRIEILNADQVEVGTTVRIYVDRSKLPFDEKQKLSIPLDVTTYLSEIAGFVEFPIVITEGSRKTIILHPDQDASEARKRFGETFEIHQVSMNYPWEKVIYPQDIDAARNLLREEKWNITSHLKNEGYEGLLNFLIPKYDYFDLTSPSNNIHIISIGKLTTENKPIRFYPESQSASTGISKSSRHSSLQSIYRDGILMSNASLDKLRIFESHGQPTKLVINISKTKTPMVNLARTEPLINSIHWDHTIHKTYQENIIKNSLKHLLELDPTERLFQMGRFCAIYHIESQSLLDNFPLDKWPMLFLDTKGKPVVIEFDRIKNTNCYSLADFNFTSQFLSHSYFRNILGLEFSKLYIDLWHNKKTYRGLLNYWNGERCLPEASSFYSISNSISRANGLVWFIIYNFYKFSSIQFLTSPWKNLPPLVQEIWEPNKLPIQFPNINVLLEKAYKTPNQLSNSELDMFTRLTNITKIKVFSQPFNNHFAYGFLYYNFNHPITQILIQLFALNKLAKERKLLSLEHIGILDDAIHNSKTNILKSIHEYLGNINLVIQSLKLKDINELPLPTMEEFIPGTVQLTTSKKKVRYIRTGKKAPFGRVLTKITS